MRRLKVDVDLDSGSLVVKGKLNDFGEIFTYAIVHCAQQATVCRNIRDMDGAARYTGTIHFVHGVKKLIEMQKYPSEYEDNLPLTSLSKQERHELVLLERIRREALRTRKEA